ncbi:fatty acid desaturase [Sinimarinibacterium thermocellulolyticum]|uniref:Fatty acid desaturase n=1 Tax=Sinimarinibacterium thermocellulolyticum TaxID=3170016 RepID=A0ABV2AEB7_9GAMM
MSRPKLTLDHLSPEQREAFSRLTTTPRLAWPTVAMWIVLTLTFVGVYVLCGSGLWPLGVGTVLNTVVGYLGFSVAHDAIHRSISTHTRLNDWIGQLGVMLIIPFVDLRLFRWGHVLHHRFANGARDPDSALRGAWWTLPVRWMFIDVLYLMHALRHGDRVCAPYLRNSLRMAAVAAAAIVALTLAGYGLEVLMLWFIPSRLIQLMLGFTFFWLPHVPHDVTQEQHFTRATTIRQGHEWLLGPLLQYQHYHLVHHLFPGTPFYNNYEVWKLIEPEMRKYELAVQRGFSIRPCVRPAQAQE